MGACHPLLCWPVGCVTITPEGLLGKCTHPCPQSTGHCRPELSLRVRGRGAGGASHPVPSRWMSMAPPQWWGGGPNFEANTIMAIDNGCCMLATNANVGHIEDDGGCHVAGQIPPPYLCAINLPSTLPSPFPPLSVKVNLPPPTLDPPEFLGVDILPPQPSRSTG